MTKEVDFEAGTVVTSDWLDAMQEMMSGLALNAILEKVSSTQVRIVSGTGKDQTSFNINGKMRYATGTKTLTISGAAGTKDVYVTADTSDRDFALEFGASGYTPSGTNYRKVGTVVWSGTAITSVTSLASPAPTNSPTLTGTVTIPTPDASSDTTTAVTSEWVRDLIASQYAYMSGEIRCYAGSTLPTGWLYCDGSVVSRTTYADLFAAIGTAFGAGDGSTTFGLPDLRGRVPVGLDNMNNTVGTGGGDAGRLAGSNTMGGTGGAETVALAVTELPGHTHNTGTLAIPSHTHDNGTLAIPSHTHGAGTLVIPSHSHTAGTLDIPNHSHGAGTLEMPDHSHGIGTLAISTDNAFSATQSGTGVNRANASHTHSITGSTGSGVAAAITGNTGSTPSAVSVTGSTGTTPSATGVSGATGSTPSATAVSGATGATPSATALTGTIGSTLAAAGAAAVAHDNMPPYQLFNWIIKV